MVDADATFKRAVMAYKAGRKDEARTLLMEIVAEHEHHEQAWLLLSGLVDTLEEQQICLENVVALNPGNESARKGLETVRQKITARDQRAPGFTAPASPQPPDPFGAAPDDGGFGEPPPWSPPSQQQSAPNSTFDWGAFDSSPQPPDPFGSTPVDGGFDELPPWSPPSQPQTVPPPDPFGAPATSVDWGKSDGPAAYGSGKQVQLPSNQEYDDWVQGLNLGGSSAAQDNMPSFQDDAPFGDTSLMIDSDTDSFLTNQPPASAPADPFGRNELFADDSSPWGIDSVPFADEVDASSPVSPFSSPVVPAFEPSAGFGEENTFPVDPAGKTFVCEEPPPTPRLDFDAPDEDDDGGSLWPDDAAITPQQTAAPVFGSKQGAVNVKTEAYFRLIPDEIEPKVGGIDLRSLLMLAGIAVLVVLNLVSFGTLLM
jgi:hypothetical protein